MLAKIAGRVRGIFAGNYPENREDEQLHVNNRGDLIVCQSAPPLLDTVRLGESWQINTTTGQTITSTLPTVSAGLSLTNNEPVTGKCYIIDSFGATEEVVDTGQVNNLAVVAMINKRSSTAPSGGTAETTFISLSGRPNYTGAATVKRNNIVTNDGWTPHATLGAQTAAAAAGQNWRVADCLAGYQAGLYIIPPGGSFSIQAIRTVNATSAMFFHVRWHEALITWKT